MGATARSSRPARRTGTACRWMGVGAAHPSPPWSEGTSPGGHPGTAAKSCQDRSGGGTRPLPFTRMRWRLRSALSACTHCQTAITPELKLTAGIRPINAVVTQVMPTSDIS